jgi:hypothetical protein
MYWLKGNFMGKMEWVNVLIVAVLFTGCSADAAKRTAYETLQNIHQRECMSNSALDCGQRESYDDYQREREALNEVD